MRSLPGILASRKTRHGENIYTVSQNAPNEMDIYGAIAVAEFVKVLSMAILAMALLTALLVFFLSFLR